MYADPRRILFGCENRTSFASPSGGKRGIRVAGNRQADGRIRRHHNCLAGANLGSGEAIGGIVSGKTIGAAPNRSDGDAGNRRNLTNQPCCQIPVLHGSLGSILLFALPGSLACKF